MSSILHDAMAAKAASRLLALLDSAGKNNALDRMARAIEQSAEVLLTLNDEDVREARAQSLSSSVLARMRPCCRKRENVATKNGPIGPFNVVAAWAKSGEQP